MPKKKPTKGKPKVHKDLEGFEISINEFGELTSNTSIEKLNDFLNKNVDDKKFKDRDDLDFKEEIDNEEDKSDEDVEPDKLTDIDEKDLKKPDDEE